MPKSRRSDAVDARTTDKVATTSIQKLSVLPNKDTKRASAKLFGKSKQTDDVERKRDLLKPARQHKRSNFNTGAIRMARKQGREIYEDIEEDANHNEVNMAMPHRMSWKDIRDNTHADIAVKQDFVGFKRWTDRFIEAGEEVLRQRPDPDREVNHQRFVEMRDNLIRNPGGTFSMFNFLTAANNFHANIPDIGPHKGVNNVVGERAHFNVLETPRGRSLSPMSKRVAAMTPERLSGVPVNDEYRLIDVRGDTHNAEGWANQTDLDNIRKHFPVVIKSYRKPD